MPSNDELVAALSELIAIPSVSADASHADDVRAAGSWVRDRIVAGGGEAELVETDRNPLVIGEISASERADQAPTLLCYAHFDVQPPDPLELWESSPFELTKRNGNLFARGVADDKGNLLFLVEAASRLAAAGQLPVNVRFAFDGEEEVGGDSVVKWVEQDRGPADAAMILDGAMIRRDMPSLCVGVRGMLYVHLRLRTGATDMHSGMFGGAALNAIHALMHALEGVVAGPDGRLPEALRAGVVAPTADELAAWSVLPPGSDDLENYGATPIAPGAADEFHLRVFADTSLDVNGIAGGSPDLVKTVLPVEARANVSVRLAPSQDPEEIRQTFERLVRERVPEGAELEIIVRNTARPAVTSPDTAAVQLAAAAFEQVVGHRPVFVRSGGTLPIYAALVARGLPTFATGFGVESEANVHAPNENVPEEHVAMAVDTLSQTFRGFAALR